jgi:predicted amidohydrolase
MSKLSVKFKSNKATTVSTEGCEDVDDFLEACKKELSLLLDSYATAQLSLSTTDGGAALCPGTFLTLIPANTDDCPLFISIVTPSRQATEIIPEPGKGDLISRPFNELRSKPLRIRSFYFTTIIGVLGCL